jgi:hypothetical protein
VGTETGFGLRRRASHAAARWCPRLLEAALLVLLRCAVVSRLLELIVFPRSAGRTKEPDILVLRPEFQTAGATSTAWLMALPLPQRHFTRARARTRSCWVSQPNLLAFLPHGRRQGGERTRQGSPTVSPRLLTNVAAPYSPTAASGREGDGPLERPRRQQEPGARASRADEVVTGGADEPPLELVPGHRHELCGRHLAVRSRRPALSLSRTDARTKARNRLSLHGAFPFSSLQR